MIYVSLDVSLNSVAVCAVDETGKLIREGTTLADAPSIVQYLEPWAGQVERVGLEAGPTSEWLTENLIELGLPAVSLEARHVKAALSAMPVKTDRNDARGIAQVVRTGWFKPVHVKSIGSQRARTLAAARKHIIRSIAGGTDHKSRRWRDAHSLVRSCQRRSQAINPMVSDEGLDGACRPPARKQACEGRAGQKDGCHPSPNVG